jgi:hypothetical protein
VYCSLREISLLFAGCDDGIRFVGIWILISLTITNTLLMVLVHDIFVAKPGNASKLAKMFKEATKESHDVKNILTDMTGAYNRVIMVSQYENLNAYEQSWEKMKQNPEAMKKMEEAMKGYQDMYLTGSREIFQVW